MRSSWAVLAISFLFSTQLLAFSLPLHPGAEVLAMDDDPYFTKDYDFEGIVALNNCSGSFIRFEDSEDSDKAMVLTNGHCVKFMGPTEVILNQPVSRSFKFLSSTGASKGSVSSTRILFATMSRTDMAIYELNRTFAEVISQFQVEPLTIAASYPEVGADIEIVSGYWKRGYSCQVEKIVYRLKESDWTMHDSIRYSRPGCDVIGGTSGSPVILAGTRTVVGVNNTINENGRQCAMNNPCEVDEQGNITYQRGYGYAQQVSWVYGCRNEAGNFDLTIEGCMLPKP